jgi:transcriptional regulator with XRE-family HTH domain
MAAAFDYELISSELIRSLRAQRSCASMSRRAGYRTNVVHRWERQQAWPTAAAFLGVCSRLGLDVNKIYESFFRQNPAWLGRMNPTSPEAVAAFLRQLRGKSAVTLLAERTGVNRYTMARWLKGTSEPRLPDFLRIVETLSRRMLDFLALVVDPSTLPSIKRRWARAQAARAIAYEEPKSHAVLRALELDEYVRHGFAVPGWLERRLGMSTAEIERCIGALKQAGQIRRRRGAWRPVDVLRIDTRTNPAGARSAKLSWLKVAAERLEANSPGNFGFSLFAISRQDLRRLRDLHLEYVRSMQTLIASSTKSECVALYCAQLVDLDIGEENALA